MSKLAEINAIGYTTLACFLLSVEWNYHLENEHLYTEARHHLVVVCTTGVFIAIVGFLMALYFVLKLRRHGSR